MHYTNRIVAICLFSVTFVSNGCKPKPGSSSPDNRSASEAIEVGTSQESDVVELSPATVGQSEPVEPGLIELDAEKLLAARLSSEPASEGWVRLFDGLTLLGWQMNSQANWKVQDGTLTADQGDAGLLCTTTRWRDFELTLEFKASDETNSGIFLRTPLLPSNPRRDCYELNIASADDPFPTGGLVKRERVEPESIGDLDADAWHRYDVRVEGGEVTVDLDGKQVLEYTDSSPLPSGFVGLQFRKGPIAFRDIRIRPLGLQSLLSEEIEDNWRRYPEMPGKYEMSDDGLHITGGRAQLESQRELSDFVLLTEVRTNAPDLNSGIFFRCIPGDQMMGYECQISNATKDGNPLFPADCGTGGFFRRHDARIIAAADEQWFSMLLVADGPTMTTWVNGLQVAQWTDRRDPDENPRKGLRLSPGTLMLQAHDPTTDIHIKQLAVASLADTTPNSED